MEPFDQVISPVGIDASAIPGDDRLIKTTDKYEETISFESAEVSPNAAKILGAVQDSINVQEMLKESHPIVSAKLLIVAAMRGRTKVTKAVVKTFVRNNNPTLSNVDEMRLVATIYDLVVAHVHAGWQTSDECKSLMRYLKSAAAQDNSNTVDTQGK